MNTRKFSRVAFSVAATVVCGERSFTGDVENLSMKGMFVYTEEKLQIGEPVNITISLTGTEPEIRVDFEGVVSRIAENGVAFNFEKIDIDSYTHLKNIIAYNIDDAEKVTEEIHHSIDEKLATIK